MEKGRKRGVSGVEMGGELLLDDELLLEDSLVLGVALRRSGKKAVLLSNELLPDPLDDASNVGGVKRKRS